MDEKNKRRSEQKRVYMMTINAMDPLSNPLQNIGQERKKEKEIELESMQQLLVTQRQLTLQINVLSSVLDLYKNLLNQKGATEPEHKESIVVKNDHNKTQTPKESHHQAEKSNDKLRQTQHSENMQSKPTYDPLSLNQSYQTHQNTPLADTTHEQKAHHAKEKPKKGAIDKSRQRLLQNTGQARSKEVEKQLKESLGLTPTEKTIASKQVEQTYSSQLRKPEVGFEKSEGEEVVKEQGLERPDEIEENLAGNEQESQATPTASAKGMGAIGPGKTSQTPPNEGPTEDESTSPTDLVKPGASAGPGMRAKNWPDPPSWVMFLLDWLIADRVLPGAYNLLNHFVAEADFHQAEESAINDFKRYMYKGINIKYGLTPHKWAAFEAGKGAGNAFWAGHTSYLEALYKQLGPLWHLYTLAERMSKSFQFNNSGKPSPSKGTPNSMLAIFKQLHKDLQKAFSKVMGGNFWGFIKNLATVQGHIKNHTFNPNQLIPSFNADLSFCVEKMMNQNPFTSRTIRNTENKTTKRTVNPNPNWKNAFNNLAISGPWAGANSAMNQIDTSLTTLATQDQANIRIAFYGLTTKVDAATQFAQIVGEMLSTIAANLRGASK